MKHKATIRICYLLVTAFSLTAYGCSTLNTARVASAGVKAFQAATLSDNQVESYVHEYIQQLDAQNTIASGNDPYAVRLNRVTSNINGKDGINLKVYKTNDVNAFATADGSVRVYSGLMDIMTDEELLGVIGHEIGHVRNKDTKDAFRNALLTSALRDGISSTGGVIGALSDSQVGALAESVSNSQYSQKQELAADKYGYEFLKANGYNPWAMYFSLLRLQEIQQSGTRTAGIQQLLSTHPDIAQRASKLEQMAKKDGIAKPANGSVATGSGSGSTTSKEWTF